MKDIYNVFLTKTIPDFLVPENNISFIKFVFDEKTLKEFENHLNKDDSDSYYQGLTSIQYLRNIRQKWLNGEDEIFIPVHDSDEFFSLLQELIDVHSRGGFHSLVDHRNFIRSIWLRMSPSDITDVEYFLKKQLVFLKNASRLDKFPQELTCLGEKERLICEIQDNRDWFEANENIIFSIIKDIGTEEEYPYLPISIRYNFPAIHFELARKNEKPTCFIYGIQNISSSLSHKNEEIKEELQPLRRKFRNRYVSSDFIISLGLFLDYLYEHQIRDIEFSSLQVFNYTYHESLSNWVEEELAKYSEDEKAELEQLYESGIRNNRVYQYFNIKRLKDIFFEKQDLISQNKTERFLHTIMELIDYYPSIELISEPFVQSENMIIHLNGSLNILEDIYEQKRAK